MSTAVVRVRPERGPLHPLVAQAFERLLDGDPAGCFALARRLEPLARALGDRATVMHCIAATAQALLALDEPHAAARASRRLLDELGDDDPPLWRAWALGLVASAEVERGGLLAALDPAAQALALIERGPFGKRLHVLACAVIAQVLVELSLFETAAELLGRAARRAEADGTDAIAVAVAVRRLVHVDLLWAARLELLGEHGAAARRYAALASSTLWMQRLSRDGGRPWMADAAAAAEAHATERLGEPALAAARALPALRARPHLVRLAEWLPGRLALARAASAAGRVDEARRYVAELEGGRGSRHRALWEGCVELGLADLSELTDRSTAAAALWRGIAASGSRRMWEEREARAADLRHRILREELAQRRARTARELLLDPLTRLGNRRLLEQELEARSSVAVLFIDLDRFKQINDTLGHAVGDAVLRRLAALLRECCRSDDVLLRYGGDEFVVLLAPGEPAARAVGRRVLERVRAENWSDLVGTLPVTVSVGVSGEGEVANALRRSDAAMLAAKRAGRDRLVQL